MNAHRLILSILATSLGGLLFASAPALAAPETPETLSPASAITSTTAVVQGVLNPGGPGEAGTYEFLYRASASECEGGAAAPVPAELAFGAERETVSVKLTRLAPSTQYTFCLLARNAAEEVSVGAAVTFTTAAPSAPAIAATSATDVASASAKLHAEINPGGADVTYSFQYGTSSAYGQSTPATALPIADESDHPVSASLAGLEPDTTYHYRILASNSQSPAGGTPGPDETFTTQATGEAFALPDGREYELVSPPAKDGAEALGIVATSTAGRARGVPGGTAATQAAADGSGITYLTSAPVGANPRGNLYASQILSTRTADGWTSRDISNPHPIVHGFAFDHGEEYRLFSADLSRAAVQEPSFSTYEPSRAPEIHQQTNADEIYVGESGADAFQALVPEEALNTNQAPELEGATPDLSHVVFSSTETYEWFNGQERLVNVLPNGATSTERRLAANPRVAIGRGPGEDPDRHAISDDGSRIVWSGGGLFTRDMNSEVTVQVDLPQGGAGSAGEGLFEGASSDGSRVFFTDSGELTPGAPAGALYLFNVSDGRLSDLTPGANGEEIIVVGANEAGTAIYLAAPAVLTGTANARGETATAGASNLYVLRESPGGNGAWSTTFIATLSHEDAEALFFEGASGEGGERPVNLAMRVSPNGRFLAFMSNQSLTGYDNEDVTSERPGERRDEEVYLYDATAASLVCASCDPTGARPAGERDTGSLAMDPTETWSSSHEFSHPYWLAALIPGSNPGYIPERVYEVVGRSLYQSRVLSDSGRLFFDAATALVPRDVNGREDVYEYEPAGDGSCAGNSGCVALISKGAGSDDSTFVDASQSGGDVFFTTQDRLVAQDQDGAADMYDAHLCTGAAPCHSADAVSSPPCATADGCRAAQSPQPGVFGNPASATFTGVGNLAPTVTRVVKPRKKPKTAAQVRAEKLTKALKACKKQSRSKRGRCDAQARKRYGKVKTSGRRAK